MVTGKLFQLDLLQEKSYVLSLQWQWSEMPSIFDHQEICTFRCNRTYTVCCSVAFLCSHDTKEKKKSFTSLYILTLQYLPCANEGCKDQVSRICMPESLTCPMSKCMILLQCLLILTRHRWKKKKNSKLHPQEEVGSNSLSPQQGEKRKKHFWDLGPSWGNAVIQFCFVF